MPKFKVKEVTPLFNVEIYEVEAGTEEEALTIYCNELAGSIEPIQQYYTSEADEDITVVK